MQRLARGLVLATVRLGIVLTGLWGTLALWFRLPGPDALRGAMAGLFLLFAITCLVGTLTNRRQRAILAFSLVMAGIVGWWSTIHPRADKDWSPDGARQVTGIVDGEILTLTGVRNFTWHSDTDFNERWETRRYDLAQLRTLDLFMSYWSGPFIAHAILSFGFEDGSHIAWSIEVRRANGEIYAPIAGAFKSNELMIIAADEKDVVRVRSNIRGEDVQLYRLRISPAKARALLLEYVSDSNALAQTPAFYNSITTNCTTVIFKMMRAPGVRVPLDWRLIVNGFIPQFAHDRGVVDTRIPFEELQALARITPRALAAGDSPDFSQAIRVGVPVPAP